MRMAGRFSWRLRLGQKRTASPSSTARPAKTNTGWGSNLSPLTKKPGLFMILLSKAPALVWEAQVTGTGKLGQLVPQKPWPYVHHYSFHMVSYPRSGRGPPDDQDEWTPSLRGTGDAERTRVRALSGAKSRSRFHQTGQLLYYCHQRRRVSAGRRHLVLKRDCRASAPVLRALDLYHLSLLCSGSGGPGAERLSLPILGLSDGVQS
jgi:hypothetical protein